MHSSCLIIAGEKSGEEHALTFFDHLKKNLDNPSFFGVGGDELKKRDFELLFHLNDFSSFGFSEVITKIPFYFKAMSRIIEEVEKRGTRVAILIDFQDFNLRLAQKLKKRGVAVFYYVAPQAWVWKAHRASILQRCVHTLFTILPFEKEWFSKRGVKSVFSVDHPLYTHYHKKIAESKRETNFPVKNLLILPGSRNFEVASLLPDFMKTAHYLLKEFNLRLHLVRSPSVKNEHYAKYLHLFTRVYESDEITYALENADVALAASGTVTLTCALFSVPTVVCYKGTLLNEFIYYNFLNYKGDVSLANIIHGKTIFPELLAERATPFNMRRELLKWLRNRDAYEKTKRELASTLNLIRGTDGEAAEFLVSQIKKIYAS